MTEQSKLCGFQPKERAAANAAGETTYFTGRPCKHGHIERRVTLSGVCLECCKKTQHQNLKRRLAENPNLYKDRYAKDPDKHKQKAAKYRADNPEKHRQSYLNAMRKRKPQKAAAEMARQAAKLHATPSWLTKEDWKKMDAVYIAARQTSLLAGFNCQVDHIVPLKGKSVCGLHVPWNLRVVSQSYNSKKHNNLDDAILFEPSKSGGVLVHSSALPWNWRKLNECNM
jgi:hypothetical protein